MNIELDTGRQLETLIAQRNQLLSEIAELRRRLMDTELVVDNLVSQGGDDADE